MASPCSSCATCPSARASAKRSRRASTTSRCALPPDSSASPQDPRLASRARLPDPASPHALASP
eukprot:2261785-Prymnesium_polylepis.1